MTAATNPSTPTTPEDAPNRAAAPVDCDGEGPPDVWVPALSPVPVASPLPVLSPLPLLLLSPPLPLLLLPPLLAPPVGCGVPEDGE